LESQRLVGASAISGHEEEGDVVAQVAAGRGSLDKAVEEVLGASDW
jgi:hypothetical protein